MINHPAPNGTLRFNDLMTFIDDDVSCRDNLNLSNSVVDLGCQRFNRERETSI